MALISREPLGKYLFETDCLATALINNDELNMDVQKGCDAKYTSGTLSSANPPILVASPKPLSSHMGSRSILTTKISSFEFKFYDLTR